MKISGITEITRDSANCSLIYRSTAQLFCCIVISGLLSSSLQAQILTTLHHFGGTFDGSQPHSTLLLSGDTLYGSTTYGGTTGQGTVFKLNLDGTGFLTLYTFTDSDLDANAANPYGPLALYQGALYGTASGTPSGTVFKINADGSGQGFLHIFSDGLDGGEPFGGVVLSGTNLYGTTSSGSVFKINTDGTGFSILHCLSCDANISGSDKVIYGSVAVGDGYVYGTSLGGGSANAGLIYKVSTSGTNFTILHEFAGSDGKGPWSGLVLVNNRLYGTTTSGGSAGSGVVFAINTDGTGFTNLHQFVGLEGGWPQSGLVCSGNTLYGAAMQGGGVGTAGTIFTLNTDGTGFTNLYVFSGHEDGGAPAAGLTLFDGNLYGTTTTGGIAGSGTIFRFALPPPSPAAIGRSQSNLVITWPTNSSSLVLQSSADLISWQTVTGAPVLNGQYTVTNPIPGSHQFFRLSR